MYSSGVQYISVFIPKDCTYALSLPSHHVTLMEWRILKELLIRVK